jgi:hypothetical protein
VLSLNDHAFRFLDAAAGLGRVFSHHINAASLSPERLVNAILQRHNLSGLRLKFAPPPAEHPRLAALKRSLGLELDSETRFFDEIYRQSGGVFRSASELWLANIERVEAGGVEMRFPARPSFSVITSELNQLDHFTLLSILQHGSLDDFEIAVTLCEPVIDSRMRLQRLGAMKLVEKDPKHPGFRVRPEASMPVLEVLSRVNLI